MARQKSPEELSAAELERLLYARRHMEREQRLRRAQAEGRIVVPDPGRDAAGDLPAVPPVEAALPAVPRRSF